MLRCLDSLRLEYVEMRFCFLPFSLDFIDITHLFSLGTNNKSNILNLAYMVLLLQLLLLLKCEKKPEIIIFYGPIDNCNSNKHFSNLTVYAFAYA